MEMKHFNELDTDYDVELLASSAKKHLNNSLLLLGLYAVILVVSVLAVIFFGIIRTRFRYRYYCGLYFRFPYLKAT